MANKSNSETNVKIGKMLQSAREYRKISQVEMAKAVDLSGNHISVLETGQSKASVELLLGYCKKLDMTPNDILGFQDGKILPELKDILIKLNKEQQQKIISMIKLMNL